MRFNEGDRVRLSESGRVGTVREVLNGDPLDLDDTVLVVEWDDAGDSEVDPTVNQLGARLIRVSMSDT